MKNSILIGLFIFLFTTSFAQTGNNKTASDLLNRVSAKMSSATTIKADFVNTMENIQENISETMNGTIHLKGSKYKLSISGVEIFNNGNTIWSYMKDAEEVNISSVEDDEEENLLDPTKIFTMWNKDFKVKFVNEKFINAKAIYVIDLFPTDLGKSYSRITMHIDKDKEEIVKIKYISKDGNNYIIDINSLKTNTEMPDAMFSFDTSKHPDVEVIDMR